MLLEPPLRKRLEETGTGDPAFQLDWYKYGTSLFPCYCWLFATDFVLLTITINNVKY